MAFNEFGTMAAVSDGTFTFNGAYLTGAWNDGLNITVDGLLGGVQLYSETVVANTSGPIFFNFNYTGIDEVTFNSFGGTPHGFPSGGQGTQFAMDNFTLNQTPEPSTLILAALGGLALLAYRRRLEPTMRALFAVIMLLAVASPP